MKKVWKNELARDILALGSWVFYLLVIGRALIQPYRPFADQVVIAGVLIVLASIIVVDFKGYLSRALVLVIFTSLFYNSLIYTLFVSVAGIMLIVSHYITYGDIKKIFWELVIGGLALACGYYGALLSLELI